MGNRHSSYPPDIKPLLSVLTANSVDFVLTGSVAAIAYGVETNPGDLDITPAMNRKNLERLAIVLKEVEATPENLGHWEIKPDGEKKWILDEVLLQVLENWAPDLNELSTFDHLFFTRFGNFDIVPELAFDYKTLIKSAVKKEIYGHQIWVAHIDTILAKLTIPRREKDIARVQKLREIQYTQQIATKNNQPE